MAGKSLLRLLLIVATGFYLSDPLAFGQEPPSTSVGLSSPDPKSASISGRVLMPSGASADFNIKVTLRNSQSPLMTFYTDKHGEFRFANLTEGNYFIDIAGDPKFYDLVTQTVRLGRGQEAHFTVPLRRKDQASDIRLGAGVVSAPEFTQSVPVAARKAYERATKLINRGNLREGIEHLKRAIEIYPDYQIARNDLGAQYLKLRQLDEATEQFLIAIERNPKYFNPRLNLGLVLIEEKRYAEAIDQLSQAVSLDSAQPAAHLWLAVALLETNQIIEAERELLKTLLLGGSRYSVAHYYIAHIHLMKGERAEAMRELKLYLEESPAGEQAIAARSLLEKLKPVKN
jgi:Tfp pilus assembly protein PilF